MLAHLDRSGKRSERAGDAGPDLKRIRLLLVEGELCLGLVDLGLRGGELDLDGLLVHVDLFLADLVLRGQLLGGVFRGLLSPRPEITPRS